MKCGLSQKNGMRVVIMLACMMFCLGQLHAAEPDMVDSWIETLLESSGGDINGYMDDEIGFTPLMTSLIFSFEGTVEKLISMGADVNKPAKNGMTPLMLAATFDLVDHTRLLISKRANVNATVKDENGKTITALSIAQDNNNEEIVKILKAAGAR